MRPLLAVLALIVALKVAEQAYRYLAYRDERAAIAAMRGRLVDAGAEVVRTRMRADSLRTEVEEADRKLAARRKEVDGYGRFAEGGALPDSVYQLYRADLRRYNADVAERNATLRVYTQIVGRNRVVSERYNALADSIESLTTRIGDSFYPIPKPIEAAAERGVIRLPP